MSDNRKYLMIPFDAKDSIKEMYPGRISWDKEKKLWYTKHAPTYADLSGFHIHVLNVKYTKREKAKLLGAKWDGSNWICSKMNYEKHQSSFDVLRDPTTDFDDDLNESEDDSSEPPKCCPTCGKEI